MKLARFNSQLTGRCSLKVGRHLNLTKTLLKHPPVLVLSRPAGNLSPSNVRRVHGLMGSLPDLCSYAILVSSRVLSRVRLVTSSVKVLGRKQLLFRKDVGSLHRCTLRSNFTTSGLRSIFLSVIRGSGVSEGRETGL